MKNVTVPAQTRLGDKTYFPGTAIVDDTSATALDNAGASTAGDYNGPARNAKGIEFKADIDASGNPNFPAANTGDVYRVSVAGKLGGASGIGVEIGDIALCILDNSAAGSAASVGANWAIIQTNIIAPAIGAIHSYPKTTNGAQTLLAAGPVDRLVIIIINIITTFAAGDGAAPAFIVGETSTTNKFKATFNTGTAGDQFVLYGTLSATKALLVTGTPATGTTSAGAIDVVAMASPLT